LWWIELRSDPPAGGPGPARQQRTDLPCGPDPARQAPCAVGHELAAIDWNAAWLEPWRAIGAPVARQVLAGWPQCAALNAAAAAQQPSAPEPPMRFVAHGELPPGTAYEDYIFKSRQCPTREGVHDFFNALAWLHFPQIKRRLNQLHVAQLAQTGNAPVRGPARDALTVFDENVALLRAPDALWDALVAKDWPRLLTDLRPLWQQASLVLFGHALLEKLLAPRKSITAHIYRVHPAIDTIASLDQWVAADLNAAKLAAKPFAHLPVLAVPGWWAGNDAPGFYADAAVFRPVRSAQKRQP